MRTEVALAARVDESGEVRALPWREWEELRQAIEALGEPPVRPPLLLERSRDPDRDTVELLEGMSARAPWASEYRWRLARLLKRRGELRRRNGEIADAIGDFERSVGLLENLRAPMPGEDYLRELGLTYDALCDACAAGRRLPRAAETHGKLVKFLRSIPPDPSVADYYLLLARKSGPLANLLESEGRASAGARVRADATGLLEAIVTAFPGNREYRLEYARALCALARAIEIRSGHEERTDATTARRKAISIYDELLAESPAPFDCRSERDACAAPASAALESSEAR